jgi:NTE family protein
MQNLIRFNNQLIDFVTLRCNLTQASLQIRRIPKGGAMKMLTRAGYIAGSRLRGLASRGRTACVHRERPKRLLSLALQGGGSFGAFTWGVLDRLLREDDVAIDMVSGTSAGAVNAVLLADGLAEGGAEAARRRLERFWQRIGTAAASAGMTTPAAGAAAIALDLASRVISPYHFNPLGLNPLRAILTEEIDFARLRRAAAVRLLIGATRIRDGKLRLFRNDEITLDAVLASACLPHLQHAVEVDGEWYWDGGLSANPPLRQLVLESAADDVLLVQITPQAQDGVPQLAQDISRRVSEITLNGPLQREIEGLADIAAALGRGRIFRSRLGRKLRRLRLHRIAAEDAMDGLHQASMLALDRAFLTKLRQSGETAAEACLPGLLDAQA